MSLLQLVYVSRRSPRLDAVALDEVVAQSRINNGRRDVSGVLLCLGEHLLQLLEGDPEIVVALYERIAQDDRHVDVQCLLAKPVNRRMFPEWGMELCDLKMKAKLDLARMKRLIESVRANHTTGQRSVEARLLLHDFEMQCSSS